MSADLVLAGAGQVVPVTSTVNTDNYHQQELEQCLVLYCIEYSQTIVKLRRGSGKDRQGMAPKAKGLKA